MHSAEKNITGRRLSNFLKKADQKIINEIKETLKEAYTNNPTWATYGITTIDRFGLGRRIKPWMVDKWELYRISQYCDQLVPDGKGGQEPRFICNLNLQSKADAWSLLRAIRRAFVLWSRPSLWRYVQRQAMSMDFSWLVAAQSYRDLYQRLM